jgi:hypothetical protein
VLSLFDSLHCCRIKYFSWTPGGLMLSVVNASSLMCVSPPSHKSRPVHSEVGTRRERAHPESTPACTRACTPCRRPLGLCSLSSSPCIAVESDTFSGEFCGRTWPDFAHSPSAPNTTLPASKSANRTSLVSITSPVSRRLQFWNLILMMTPWQMAEGQQNSCLSLSRVSLLWSLLPWVQGDERPLHRPATCKIPVDVSRIMDGNVSRRDNPPAVHAPCPSTSRTIKPWFLQET